MSFPPHTDLAGRALPWAGGYQRGAIPLPSSPKNEFCFAEDCELLPVGWGGEAHPALTATPSGERVGDGSPCREQSLAGPAEVEWGFAALAHQQMAAGQLSRGSLVPWLGAVPHLHCRDTSHLHPHTSEQSQPLGLSPTLLCAFPFSSTCYYLLLQKLLPSSAALLPLHH